MIKYLERMYHNLYGREIVFKMCLIWNHREKNLSSPWVFGDYVINPEYKHTFKINYNCFPLLYILIFDLSWKGFFLLLLYNVVKKTLGLWVLGLKLNFRIWEKGKKLDWELGHSNNEAFPSEDRIRACLVLVLWWSITHRITQTTQTLLTALQSHLPVCCCFEDLVRSSWWEAG